MTDADSDGNRLSCVDSNGNVWNRRYLAVRVRCIRCRCRFDPVDGNGARSIPCHIPETIEFPPCSSSPSGNPGIPRRGFSFGERHPAAFTPGLCVGDREARADGQSGELIDRIAPSTRP
jgi:hypothetical protein